MHLGIFGGSMCGKTTLARVLVMRSRKARRPSLVYCPFNDPAWKRAGAAFVTDDIEHLKSQMNRTPDASVYIDESFDLRGNKDMEKFARKYRHSGHNLTYCGQRPIDCVPGIRSNLHAIFLFRTGKADCESMAAEFVRDECMEATTLEKGEYLYIPRFGECYRGNVAQFFGKI